MLLSREIYNPARPPKLRDFHDKDPTNLYFTRLASSRVASVVLVKTILEHQSNTLAHDTYRIHGIDEDLCGRLKQIASRVTNHQKYHAVRA